MIPIYKSKIRGFFGDFEAGLVNPKKIIMQFLLF